MSKFCSVCGIAIESNDPRKQYCSNACKQEAHRQRHGIDRPTFLNSGEVKTPEGSKVSEHAQLKPSEVVERVEMDDRFVTVAQAIVELNSKVYKLQFQKDSLLAKVASMQSKRSPLGDMVDGLKKGSELGQQLKESSGKEEANKLGLLMGVLSAFNSIQNTDHDKVNRKNQIKMRIIRSDIREIDEQINELTAKRIYLENGLSQLKKEIKSELTSTLTSEKALLTTSTHKPSESLPVRREENRIISLSELKAQEFDVYNFSEGFDEIIGNPAKNFSMVVYGESGQGKSTWVIEFANYLAETHGKVLYNSSEERISQSLKRKLLKYDSDNFAIAECQNYKALKQAIRGNGFKFVVIDSINDMNIKPNELAELTERNADKAFIFIMQATKQGNYKGSSQFVHDADILIRLESYQPIVEKTRYK